MPRRNDIPAMPKTRPTISIRALGFMASSITAPPATNKEGSPQVTQESKPSSTLAA